MTYQVVFAKLLSVDVYEASLFKTRGQFRGASKVTGKNLRKFTLYLGLKLGTERRLVNRCVERSNREVLNIVGWIQFHRVSMTNRKDGFRQG